MFQDVFAGVLGLGSFAGSVGGVSYLATTIAISSSGIVVPLGLMAAVGLFFAGKRSKGELG